MTRVQSVIGDFDMLNSWFAITFHAARLGFETQNAVAFRLMRLIGDASKTEAGDMAHVIADKITEPPNVQAAETDIAPDGGRRRESVDKVHKKRVRANKRKRSK